MKNLIATILCLFMSLSGFCDKFVWNSKSPYPSFARHRSAAFSIGNKGYMGTGHINSGTISMAYTDWWEFDPSSNTWTQKADYPQPRFACAGFTIGNKGYLGGGNEQNFGDRDEFYEFNPVTNVWTPKATLPIANGGGFGFAINGVGYMALSGSLYSYNVTTDAWTYVPCGVPFQDYSSGFVINNKVYVLPTYSQTLYVFDPATGITTTKANFIGEARYAACSFAVRGQGYIGLGWGTSTGNVVKDFYYYDPILDVWDTIPKSFPGVRRNYVPSFVVGDNAYFGTGSNGTNLGDIWGYEWKLSVGINEQSQANAMTLFPNPTQDIIHIILSEKTLVSRPLFKLFQLDGKEVFSKSLTEIDSQFNMSELAQGVYISTITDNQQAIISTKKIVKN
jgi:N-acetylneuraminic acid mutarotase